MTSSKSQFAFPLMRGSTRRAYPLSYLFRRYTQELTNAPCHYGLIEPSHWNQPDWRVVASSSSRVRPTSRSS